jgi:rubrerythrin
MNLEESFARDSQAYVKFLAFAAKAEAEGHTLPAKLFRAAAGARKIYIDTYLETQVLVNSTADNLGAIIDSEVYEADELYPGFIETAKKEDYPETKRTFIVARSAKMKNIRLYEAALVELGKESAADYFLCTMCGFIHKGHEPVDCPVCGKGPGALKRI